MRPETLLSHVLFGPDGNHNMRPETLDKPPVIWPSHAIRELEWNQERGEWYAKLIHSKTGEAIVIGDLSYILQWVEERTEVQIIETGGF